MGTLTQMGEESLTLSWWPRVALHCVSLATISYYSALAVSVIAILVLRTAAV